MQDDMKREWNCTPRPPGFSVAVSLWAALCLYAATPAFSAESKPQELLDLPSLPVDSNTPKPQLPVSDKNTAAPATSPSVAPSPAASVPPAPPALSGADSSLPAVPVPVVATPPQPVPLPPAPNNNDALRVIAPQNAVPSDTGKPSLTNAPAIPVVPAQQAPSAASAPAPQDANTPALPAIPIVPATPGAPASTGALEMPAAHATPGQPETPAVSVAPDSDRTNNLTLMFSSDDMAVIAKMLRAYDSYDEHKAAPTQKDKISDLFPIDETPAPQAVQAELPNLYLGSIVYTSPKSWVITVNGRKISSTHNSPGSELYVTQISRKEIEIIWKPHSLNDVPEKWNQATEGGKNTIPGIVVDAANGSIRLHMLPNQTFIPGKLAIKEGLIKPDQSFFDKFKEAIDSLTKSPAPSTVRQP